MQCLKESWHHNGTFVGIQAIYKPCVQTQPQATGRKIPNEDNKKSRCHVFTCKGDRKSR